MLVLLSAPVRQVSLRGKVCPISIAPHEILAILVGPAILFSQVSIVCQVIVAILVSRGSLLRPGALVTLACLGILVILVSLASLVSIICLGIGLLSVWPQP